MFKDRKVTTIIVAAGRGSRFGGSLPKQFMKIDGMTVLEKAILPFQDHPAVDRIIVAAAEEYMEQSENSSTNLIDPPCHKRRTRRNNFREVSFVRFSQLFVIKIFRYVCPQKSLW